MSEIKEAVHDGVVGPQDLIPRLKDEGYDAERVERRRAWIEKRTGASLKHSAKCSYDTELMRGNIENPIGVTQIPLGVTGPVLVEGQHAKGLFYVPMATTEGALVRSYERGMMALTRAGGVHATVLEDENQTAPTFFFQDVAAARGFAAWLDEHFADLKREAETTTRHGKMQRVKCYQLGRQVIVNFGFSTADAQGMNMIVKATDAACRWIESHHPGVTYFQIGRAHV